MDSAVTFRARFASQMAGEPKAWLSPMERMLLRRGLQDAPRFQHPTPFPQFQSKRPVSGTMGWLKGGWFERPRLPRWLRARRRPARPELGRCCPSPPTAVGCGSGSRVPGLTPGAYLGGSDLERASP